MGHEIGCVRPRHEVGRRVGLASPRRFIASLVSIWRDRRGVTSLEFALCFPMIMVLMLGAMEIYRILYFETQLQGAIADTSRYGLVGNATQDALNNVSCPTAYGNLTSTGGTGDPKYQLTCRLDEDLCPNGPAMNQCPFNTALVTLNVFNFSGFQALAANQQNLSNDVGGSGVGGANTVNIYTATYNMPLATGVLSQQSGIEVFKPTPGVAHFPTFPIAGYIVVYNEPFLLVN
jgi:hypothetical protein